MCEDIPGHCAGCDVSRVVGGVRGETRTAAVSLDLSSVESTSDPAVAVQLVALCDQVPVFALAHWFPVPVAESAGFMFSSSPMQDSSLVFFSLAFLLMSDLSDATVLSFRMSIFSCFPSRSS